MTYGVSGDIRADLNAHLPAAHANYKGEDVLPGALIEAGRDFATQEIDATLKPRYGEHIPFTTVPALIDKIANALAEEFVQDKMNPGPAPKTQDKYSTNAKRCRDILESLAEGTMELPEVDDPEGGQVFHTHANRAPAMDVDATEDQEVDPDLLDDISNNRG